jgi:lipopolysaccharide/colanic/teichoic acid biosynthesis glycosyltransferase
MYIKVWKRVLDIAAALLGAILLWPVLAVLAALGAIIMRGNPFFVQIRPGKDEKLFKMVKFRSMTCAKDQSGNLLPDDQRLTAYGRFLRSSSLDELPELWNILKGDMSIVGPRPQLVRDMVFMTEDQRRRHSVPQGLTGLAQINGRNNMTWEQKIEYDLQYIENITFRADFCILLKTVVKVFARDGIASEGMDTAQDLGDYLLSAGRVSQAEYDEKQAEAEALLQCKAHCREAV